MRADSPNGRAAHAASAIDGRTLHGIEAVGKHLLYDFGDELYLHVHLGRFGNFDDGPLPLPAPKGILRFRMFSENHWFELRGAIAIEVYDRDARERLESRIGPNPLTPGDDPKRAFAKIHKSRVAIALLLMDQSVIAGVGNIYRSEILFLHGLHPRRPGTSLDMRTWRALWRDLRRLMEDGARIGRIVTTDPKDREKPKGAVRSRDRFYTYRRTGQPCRRCGAPIETAVVANRNVFWCPRDQPEWVGP